MRIKTDYPGVNYIMGISKSTGRPERIYYINYYRNGRRIEEKAGRQYQDNMTAAKANRVRGAKIDGNLLSNNEQRELAKKIRINANNRYASMLIIRKQNF